MKTGNWDPDMWHQKKKPPGIDMSDIKTSKDSTSGGSGSGDRPSSASEIHTKVAPIYHSFIFSVKFHLSFQLCFSVIFAQFLDYVEKFDFKSSCWVSVFVKKIWILYNVWFMACPYLALKNRSKNEDSFLTVLNM